MLIEFWDFRGSGVFEELIEAVSASLNVNVIITSEEDIPRQNGDYGEPIVPHCFEWEGAQFIISWELEYGCFVQGDISQKKEIEKLAKIFSCGYFYEEENTKLTQNDTLVSKIRDFFSY